MRKLFLSLVIALPSVLITLAVACSSSNDTGGGAGATCQKAADCSSGNVCGFNDAKGCSAVGTCMAPSPATPYPACGCSGQDVSFVAPGFTAAPVASGSQCVDAAPGPDSGSPGHDAATDAPGDDGPTEGASPTEAGLDSGESDASDAAHE